MKPIHSRIYVCHTFYHVYVTYLKELNLPASERGKATLVLSTLSNNFGDIASRIEASGLFEQVIYFDEKREDAFPEVMKWKKETGNPALKMLSRIVFTKKFGKAEASCIPVDFKSYRDIYVYCDADPIGTYLSVHRIKYHALEDGLDTLSDCVEAIYYDRQFFAFKKFLSEKLNLIFIRDGYNKYCLDIEVNDASTIRFPYKKYKSVSRIELAKNLGEAEREIILKVFIRNYDELIKRIDSLGNNAINILILTEPLCDLDTRKRIFTDLIEEYSKEGCVYLKPHPRDELDYPVVFSEVPQFDGTIPMEIFNFFPKLHFKKVISVYTQIKDIRFADEIVRLGNDFMDKYEDPSIHRKDEVI